MQITVNGLVVNATLEGSTLKLFFEKSFMRDGEPVQLGIAADVLDGRAAISRAMILDLTAPPVDDPASIRYRLNANDSWWNGPSDTELLVLMDGMQIEVTSTKN